MISTAPFKCHLMDIHPTSSRVFCTDRDLNTVAVFDYLTGVLVGAIPTGEGVEGVSFSPSGNEVWVSNRYEDTISG